MTKKVRQEASRTAKLAYVLAQRAQQSNQIKTAKLISADYPDVLKVIALDKAAEEVGEEFFIARPFLLRNFPSRGTATYTYTSFSSRIASTTVEGIDDEAQQITPDYFIDDELTIGRLDYFGLSEFPLKWIDLNVDGRAWAVNLGVVV